MSSQSPSNSSISTDQEAGTGSNPAAAFGANEWLVDEIYQQYLQDPSSVDRAWWDFFADYKPGTSGTADKPVPTVAGATVTTAPAAAPVNNTPAAAPAPVKAAAPSPAPAAPAKAAPPAAPAKPAA
ncbi:2-oxoglutarate dehydrogenase E1 subunit family protein, partial [Streptomyces halstedii]|nr:hypothetical protein [Streptomyces halstedii]